jgi:hypothetical protein
MAGQAGFFDVEERLKELSAKGDDLERLNAIVDFEAFRPDLAKAVPRSDGSKGGRPPFDHVVMFKILILQASHSLSDERAEFLMKDRLSFMRFLGLGLSDAVPDANTIWTFREALTRATVTGKPAIEVLFGAYDTALKKAGFLAMGGQIVDATNPGTQAAQLRGREGRHQGGPHPGSVEGQPGEARAKGSGRALDGQVLEGEALRGRFATHRHRCAGFRVQEPHRHRPAPWADPHLDGNPRRPSRRGAAAEPHLQGQYRERRLGGHGLPLEGE